MKEKSLKGEQPSATDKELKSSITFTKTLSDRLAVQIMNSLATMIFLLLAVSTFTI